ncbi:MAG: isoquinoline 1-oxidoreductase alpha subunit [Frankiales bacterium]|nr:isoquinoline 1-oxidoreductase alpha subunit [Frankiales bacterium]
MPTYSFTLNGKKVSVDAPADLSVLWTLRDKLQVTGPKYGCGINVCKACTSLVDGQAFNPCVTDVSQVQGRSITTIEGVASGDKLHPVQQAWLEQDVAQCGYCQPGQIISTIDLLRRTRTPSDADIDTIDNVCRCGTYFRIREAVKRSIELMDAAGMPVGGTVAKPAGTTSGSGAVAPVAVEDSLPTTGASAVAATGAAALLAGALAARAAAQSDTVAEPA